jgi:hypothetical protein
MGTAGRHFPRLRENTHDARLVAAMMVFGVGSILTFHTTDFVRYPAISVIDPRTLR